MNKYFIAIRNKALTIRHDGEIKYLCAWILTMRTIQE